MSENYPESAKRHFRDADILRERERVENADQLYGFAAECALKAALVGLGRFRDDHKVHINLLWDKMQATSFQRSFPGLAQLLAVPNGFADWHVSQRYAADGEFGEKLQEHRNYARRLLVAARVSRG